MYLVYTYNSFIYFIFNLFLTLLHILTFIFVFLRFKLVLDISFCVYVCRRGDGGGVGGLVGQGAIDVRKGFLGILKSQM